MGELTQLLRTLEGAPVDVFLADFNAYSDQNHHKNSSVTRLDLIIAPYWPGGSQRPILHFLGYITPDRIDMPDEDTPLCTLDMFSRDRSFSLEQGYELQLLNKAMKILAEADPRIKGSNQTPIVSIVRIGNERYSLDKVRKQYEWVTTQHKEHQRAGGIDYRVARF